MSDDRERRRREALSENDRQVRGARPDPTRDSVRAGAQTTPLQFFARSEGLPEYSIS